MASTIFVIFSPVTDEATFSLIEPGRVMDYHQYNELFDFQSRSLVTFFLRLLGPGYFLFQKTFFRLK
jgi:hypothetical protein